MKLLEWYDYANTSAENRLLSQEFSFLQELARKLRPNTLRAKYGKTKVQNAVHCTDLPEDGLLEVFLSVHMNVRFGYLQDRDGMLRC
jgi:nucleoside diphosphate kinase